MKEEEESVWWSACGKLLQTVAPELESDLLPNVFVFTRGVIKVQLSDADRNCLVGA